MIFEESQLMAHIYALLVKGHSNLRARAAAKEITMAARYRDLIQGFGTISRQVELTEHGRALKDRSLFAELLDGHENAMAAHRETQRGRADDFNLFDVLQLTFNEVRHSMALAWLLDHNLRKWGTHAQGTLGFKLLLKELKEEIDLPEACSDLRYTVSREVAGDNSRIDVEVACRGHFLIHIENKIWSREGDDQTPREWQDLLRRAAELGIDTGSPSPGIYALFLTPHGTAPMSPNFKALKWNRIARVFEEFAELASPRDVRLFAAHFARALRRFVLPNALTRWDDYGEGIVE
jgi:hypothetical protein